MAKRKRFLDFVIEGKKKGEKKMGNTPSRVNREEAADAMIANYVEKNEVVVFSKRTCGYCQVVKRLLSNETYRLKQMDGCSNVPQVKVVELDNDSSIEDDEMMYIRDALIRRTGLKTVPQVFINSKLVGGADDTAQMARVGGLRVALLHAAKCTPSH